MSSPTQTIAIAKLPIRLGQFLKFANLVQDGFEARVRIQNEEVMVNGCGETRRGRKLYHGDTVTMAGNTWIVELLEDESV